MRGAPVVLLQHAIWRDFGRVACPTLLVHGAESEMTTWDEAERRVRLIPGGRLAHLDGAGHRVPMDQPARFSEVVRSFLAEHSRG